VAEVDEVLDRCGGATGVIDPDAREAVDTTTHHAHRDIEGAKGVDLRLGQRQGDEQDAVHPLSEQAGREIALAHLRIAYVVQKQVETGFPDHLLNPSEQLGEEPPRQIGHDDGERARAAGGETVGGG